MDDNQYGYSHKIEKTKTKNPELRTQIDLRPRKKGKKTDQENIEINRSLREDGLSLDFRSSLNLRHMSRIVRLKTDTSPARNPKLSVACTSSEAISISFL